MRLKTEVEWQVKPGHISAVENIIRDNKKLSSFFNLKQTKLVLGKCDYMLQESDDSILANFYLVRYLHNTKHNKILQHIRKVRSYIFLEASSIVGSNPNAQKDKSQPLSWNDILEKLAVASKDFHFVDKRLKALKVSRQIRIKILKIFSNYNNGIQDPILFPLFLDFTIFIRNLIKLTEYEEQCSETKSYRLRDLEKKLNEHIKVFQEGYAVRFLNGYQFENISDFDLDFNSSIQQLLTSYGTLVHDYGKMFYEGNNYAPIIQLNNTDTISNSLSINYSTHHLTSPEFVFSTLLKEILNQFDEHNDTFKEVLNSFYEDIQSIKDDINESYLDDMIDSNLVDLNYFIIDAVRFIVTFNGDFQLFCHWFWTYNFQNSSLYDTSGMFNEQHLRMEMLRILLVKNFYSISEDLECPVPEIYTYWQRHIKKIGRISAELVKFIKSKGIDGVVELFIKKYLKTYKSYDKEYSEEIISRLKDIDSFSFVNKGHQLSKLSFINSANPNVKSRKIHLMEWLMFHSLRFQFEENKKQIILLKRDWKEGTSLPNHSKLYQDRMYAIDQTGGVYFNNIDSMNKYFTYNAKCLLQIIHFSYISKKDFIINNSKE